MAAQTGISPHGNSTRPPATGARGMVASASQHATVAGLRALQDGGNAIDAAVAVAAGLNVAEPYMSGMGGVGIGLVYIASENRTRVLNFSGHAPNNIDPSSMNRDDMEFGPLTPLVPGNIGGWLTMHDEYGTLDRAAVFSYAIGLASEGIAMSPVTASTVADTAPRIAEHTEDQSKFPLVFDSVETGSLLRQPYLAESFAAVVEGGIEEFYEGKLGDAIWRGQKAVGGVISREELAAYRPEWQEPLSGGYRGLEVRTPKPNSSAFQILETLNILDGYDLDHGSASAQHLLIEAVLKAADDRTKYSGDPKFVDIPLDRLLSQEYAEEIRGSIDPNRFSGFPPERWNRSLVEQVLPDPWSPMTTHFATADRWGNVVTITQTLGGGFGSGVVPKGTGVFLNNMGKWFDLNEGSPNDLSGGRAVDFVIAPAQIFDGSGNFVASIGTPGSYGILHTTLQIMHQFIDGGLNIQEAVEAPRFRYYDAGALYFEARFDSGLLGELESMGHTPIMLPPYTAAVGGSQAIHRTEHGTFLGAADPRRDGFALGW